MRTQNEVKALLDIRGLNTVRFQAFIFEAGEADSLYHDLVERLGTASDNEMAEVVQAVETAYKEWMSHD